MVIMSVFIVVIVIIHKQRQIRNRHKIQILKADYENTILNAEKEIREETLQYVSQELHDNIGQLLSLTKLVLNNPAPSSAMEGKRLVNQIIKEVRQLSKSINKDYLKDLKFEDFLAEELIKIEKSGFCKTKLTIEKEIGARLDGNKKLVLVRMVQECINNVIKHASPKLLSLKLMASENELELWMEDDGIGFNLAEKSNGLGIRNLKSRVEAINGTVDIASKIDSGTQIRIKIKA